MVFTGAVRKVIDGRKMRRLEGDWITWVPGDPGNFEKENGGNYNFSTDEIVADDWEVDSENCPTCGYPY